MPRRILLIPRYRVPATPLSIATMYAAAGYGIWQGLGILSSSPERFNSPALMLVHQHTTVWGITPLLFGMCVFIGLQARLFILKGIGLTGLAAWSVAFGSVAIHAYLNNPLAGPTGPPAYYYIAVNLAILVWADTKGKAGATTPPTPPAR